MVKDLCSCRKKKTLFQLLHDCAVMYDKWIGEGGCRGGGIHTTLNQIWFAKITTVKPEHCRKGHPQFITCEYDASQLIWATGLTGRVFTTFRILEISYISNVFLGFVCHSKMAPISRNYAKFFLPFFYANLYKIPGISRNSVTFYTNFSTIHHRRHSLHTAEKLQDADWGRGGGGGKTVDAATYQCWVRRKRQFTCNDYLVST